MKYFFCNFVFVSKRLESFVTRLCVGFSTSQSRLLNDSYVCDLQCNINLEQVSCKKLSIDNSASSNCQKSSHNATNLPNTFPLLPLIRVLISMSDLLPPLVK